MVIEYTLLYYQGGKTEKTVMLKFKESYLNKS